MIGDDIEAGELDAFVDGELDLAQRLKIERALENDAALRARADDLKRLRSALRECGSYHVAPDALRRRVEAMAAPARGVATRSGRAKALRRWAWWPMAAAFAAALVVAFGVQLMLAHHARDGRLADQVVASHVRATLGGRLVDVASSDHHTVKPWLSARLDYSPPVRDAELGGAVLVGARIDYLDGRPVAALVYRHGQHRVDWFVWPAEGADRAETFTSERGFEIAHWTRGGMTNWVVSDVNRVEFAALIDAFASK